MSSGDSFADGNYKYTQADRLKIDQGLYLGVEGHTHQGEVVLVDPPGDPLTLAQSATGGTLPSGVRIYYVATFVDADGNESIGNTEAYVDTPDGITEPAAPTASSTTTGGTLEPGSFYYVLSAYQTSTTVETLALYPVLITVPTGTSTNEITLTLPAVPSGATGFNVYRRRPGYSHYYYLDTVDMSVATPPSTYVDDGSVAEDCDRGLPDAASTNATNSVLVTLVNTVPADHTWKLYRTYDNTDYSISYLTELVAVGATPTVPTTYTDAGTAVAAGAPPTSTGSFGSPSKILLTSGREVQGILPAGMAVYPFEITFFFEGVLEVSQGSTVWVCEFPEAEIICCRASLGRGFVPASDDVIVDVNKGAASATPSFSTIFTTAANRPRVYVNQQIGERATPDVYTLVQGDTLTVDVDQIGGGATPTDRDLTVTVSLLAHGYPTTSSFQSGATGGAGGDY